MKNFSNYKTLLDHLPLYTRKLGLSDTASIYAIYIVSELQKNRSNAFSDDDKLWAECKSLSHQLRIPVPFRMKEDLKLAYSLMHEEIDYEILLEYYISHTKGYVHFSEAFIGLILEKMGKTGSSVLITEGEKFAPYLKSIVKNNEKCHYTITTNDELAYTLLAKIFEGQKNVTIIQTSIYDKQFINENFDTILSVPSFGMKLTRIKDEFICREFELIATENLLSYLSSVGKLIILLPARATFALGSIQKLRQFIQQSYSLDEIVDLPIGILQNIHAITRLFTISAKQGNKTLIKRYIWDKGDHSNRNTNNRTLLLQNEASVTSKDLQLQGDWNVDKIFASHDPNWKYYQNLPKMALKNMAEILRGKAVNEKNPNGSFGMVNISNILNYSIDYNSLEHFNDQEDAIISYFLKTGDLLLPARGTAFRTAVFEEQAYPCIASTNLIVIRPKQNVLSGTYLKLFLDSEIGKKLLRWTQQGASLINIRYRDLENIEIPYLPYEKQIEIANKYKKNLTEYQKTVTTAEEKWHSTLRELEKLLGC